MVLEDIEPLAHSLDYHEKQWKYKRDKFMWTVKNVSFFMEGQPVLA